MTRFYLVVPSPEDAAPLGVSVFGDAPDAAEMTCSVPLSPSGDAPATHWLGSGILTDAEMGAFESATSSITGAAVQMGGDIDGFLDGAGLRRIVRAEGA